MDEIIKELISRIEDNQLSYSIHVSCCDSSLDSYEPEVEDFANGFEIKPIMVEKMEIDCLHRYKESYDPTESINEGIANLMMIIFEKNLPKKSRPFLEGGSIEIHVFS